MLYLAPKVGFWEFCFVFVFFVCFESTFKGPEILPEGPNLASEK